VRPVFTHSSWSGEGAESYERLAFLGDSVLALAVSADLFPRFEAQRFGAGWLTKIRAQAVSARACKAVAEDLGLVERLQAAAPPGASAAQLAGTTRAPGEVLEALIGACYLEFGFERTAAAVVESFRARIDVALESPEDAKSALQERLARQGRIVVYEVVAEEGPPHDRRFDVVAKVDGRQLGRGHGRSKKEAEQIAAQEALEGIG
jgi:ribonuclease-3